MPELELVAQAFYLARTGRPGPVLIDVPKDVQQQLAVPDWDVPMAISGYMQRLPQMPSTGVSHCISRAPGSILQDAAFSLPHQPQSSMVGGQAMHALHEVSWVVWRTCGHHGAGYAAGRLAQGCPLCHRLCESVCKC